MRINTIISKLGLEKKLNKDDLTIINDLKTKKFTESRPCDNKPFVDSVALIHYALTKTNKDVLIVASHIKDTDELRDKIITLIADSSLPKKTKLLKKKTKDYIEFESGVKIYFKPIRASYPGIQWSWIMINDIRLIDPPKYLKIFNNHFPVIESIKDAKLTLSP